ncbi:MAG: VTT domain-containing protein [Mycobacteriales bacterium]
MRLSSPAARTTLLWLGGLRTALAVLAVPLAPIVYKHQFLLLVLMRPSKEVLMAGGFFISQGKLEVLPLLLAALPLHTLGVWQFFALGRAFDADLRAHALKPPANRLLPQRRIDKLDHLLEHKGDRLVFYGRLAAFPGLFLAAAAGASRMSFKRFAAHDALGAALSFAELVIAGYVLGTAYEKAGLGLAIAGGVLFVAALAIFGRLLARDTPDVTLAEV